MLATMAHARKGEEVTPFDAVALVKKAWIPGTLEPSPRRRCFWHNLSPVRPAIIDTAKVIRIASVSRGEFLGPFRAMGNAQTIAYVPSKSRVLNQESVA
jgi:hypothetical protein